MRWTCTSSSSSCSGASRGGCRCPRSKSTPRHLAAAPGGGPAAAPLRRHPAGPHRSAADGPANGGYPPPLWCARRRRVSAGADARARHDAAGGGWRLVSPGGRVARGRGRRRRVSSTRPVHRAATRSSSRCWRSRCGRSCRAAPKSCSGATELATWTHAHCAIVRRRAGLRGDHASADRHLICGRCTLRWRFEPLTCPYCLNTERARITSFATPTGSTASTPATSASAT